ncbi:MAG: glycoside hydrolase family 127 protein [Verrucomicrobia bacterium]|nr:glycoside hydrolase family 127 protein [Verrucomicrobiota bacterium]
MTAKRILTISAISVSLLLGSFSLTTAQEAAELESDYNVKPVPFNKVNVGDAFWTPRLETNRQVTIPYAFQKCEETDRISNFEKAAGLFEGEHKGIYFNDSDVYKVMEGAAYSLQVNPETMMRLYLDKLINIMYGAQWDDGYLYTFFSTPEKQPEKRWRNIEAEHELYCMGHMYEAAVAHYQVTGDESFLDIAKASADLVCDVFNDQRRTDPPGHQEIEIGLCRLYRATGDKKYLDEAKFFLDQRGRPGNRGPDGNIGLYGKYSQDHKPVVEQTRAYGHSVRAAYMYTGMADVAALTGDMSYVNAIDTIWKDVADTKLYITGGIGAAGGHEGFGGAYELPNLTAYCETCASIANIFWNHRMFLMRGDAKYIDILERTLYNAALSGISMNGDRFFYPNPLESTGQHQRSPWFGCACCPSNVARFIPSIPGYAYAFKGENVYVNLFMSGEAVVATDNNNVKLTQTTRYPWSGKVDITVEPEKRDKFSIFVRIPGWARNKPVPSDLYRFLNEFDAQAVVKVNGRQVEPNIEKGYARIEREWQAGDTIRLEIPMPVRRVIAHPEVEEDIGKVALQRGPVMYCLEWPDNDGKVLNLMIPDTAELSSDFRRDLLNGVTVITGNAKVVRRTVDGGPKPGEKQAFTAIPYYAWAHRGAGEMTVWPARTPEAAKPEPAPTLTYNSKTTASFVHVSLNSIKDQVEPKSSNDGSALQLDFWPHKGTEEWIEFEWDKKHGVSSMKVYWFDDTGAGECRVPESWNVDYRDENGQWRPVNNTTPYTVEKDTFNKVEFETVETDGLKLNIKLQEDWSSGIIEVVIE